MSNGAADCPRCRELEALVRSLTAQVQTLQETIRQQAQTIQQQALRIAELEERLGLNSRNSSKPPSADPPHTPPAPKKPGTGRKRGGQPGHPRHQRQALPLQEGDERTRVRPETCHHCGEHIPPDAPLSREPRVHQVFDLPERLFTIHQYDLEDPCCPCCRKVTKARLPEGVPQGIFSPRMLTFVALLTGRFRLSRREAREFFQTILRLPVSLGLISNAEHRVSKALEPAYDEALKASRQAPVANADETSWPLAHRLAWMWVLVTKRLVVFRIARGRGREAFKALAGDFAGVLGTDRWCAYTDRELEQWQICWAHLKRDFQKLIDRGGAHRVIGEGLQAVQQDVFQLWHLFRGGTISRRTLRYRMQDPRSRMYEILEEGAAEGLRKTSPFCKNLFDAFPALWTFTEVPGVEPTNNVSEQALRKGVLWRKGCFGSDSERGARFAERMLTVCATLGKQDREAFSWLTAAISSTLSNTPTPSLLPATP